jgi:hypothetical protein
MSCRNGWNREHLEKELTKTFLGGTFKQCRENLLFDRQISMLPATQHLAEMYKMRARFDRSEEHTSELQSQRR